MEDFIGKMTILLKATYKSIAIPLKPNIFAEIEKPFLKSMQNLMRHHIAKTILKNNHVGGFTLTDFNTYYKATVIHIVWP